MAPRRVPSTPADAVTHLPGGRLLVAVSGGPDSVALLLALAEAGRDVAVGHVNHSLRGDESDADEAFVRDLAASLGVRFMIERVDARAEAKRTRQSIETAARQLRYTALQRMLEAWGGDFIATGHTEDDQAETVLMHLIRGSGAAGLAGMREAQGPIIRPLLGVSRTTVLQWLAEREQPFRHDASNLDTRFTRNRIRAQIIPALRKINPQVTGRIASTSGMLRADVEFLEDQARKALAALTVSRAAEDLVVNRIGWASLAPALSAGVTREVIRTVLGDVSDVDERHIMIMVLAVTTGSALTEQLPRGLRVRVDERTVTVSAGPLRARPRLHDMAIPVPGELALPGGTMRAEILGPCDDVAALLAVAGPFHALLDADAAGKDLRLRARWPGDRIKPTGMDGTKKVQDLMVDAHLPAEARDTLPILINTEHILWVPGLAVDRIVAAVPESRHILHVMWTPSASE